MKRPSALEQHLDAVRRHKGDPTTPEAIAELGEVLDKGAGPAVAAAAALVESHEIEKLAGLLGPALRRLLAGGVKADPGCKGKEAVVAAMVKIGIYAPEELLAGARHRQHEPVWGGTVDTAAALRGNCAVGLAQAQHRASGAICAELLADGEWQARAGAAQALGLLPNETCVPLLRYKVLSGDAEAQVMGVCLRALLAADPVDSLDFVAARLADGRAEIAEQAALALGESRARGATAKLVEAFEGATRGMRRVLLLALVLTRDDAAIEFVLARVVDADRPSAALAIDALAILRDDPRIAGRVLDAARARKDKEITRKVADVFSRP